MFAILETAAMQKLTFIAQVLVSKYADYLSLNRQAQIYARRQPESGTRGCTRHDHECASVVNMAAQTLPSHHCAKSRNNCSVSVPIQNSRTTVARCVADVSH